MKTSLLAVAFGLLGALSLAAAGPEQEHMVGRQSNNMGISIVPKPGPVKIDGDLSDWDWSGRIHSFADWDIRETHSVETAGMYDAENLYLAFKWRDPSPMLSSINPDFNPSDGWRADAVQMRLHTDRNLWITLWYYTAGKMPVMHLSYWQDDENSKVGQDISVLHGAPGETELGQGAAMAYRMGDDKKSFTQEVRIPWKLLYRTPPKVAPGMLFKLGLELLWGDDVDGSKPTHRYADNLQPGATSREFFWTATRAWGDAKLVPEGHLPVRAYAVAKAVLPGEILLHLTLPTSAERFTVVIENDRGNRVRNLLGDASLEDQKIVRLGDHADVSVAWDGLDDTGKLVPVGTYQVRGLTRAKLDAVFDAAFYNPGTPPWYTADGTGGFGSNHAAPLCVARAGRRMAASYEMSEGGHAIICFDENDKKIWGENRGGTLLAGDDDYVYAISREVWTAEHEVRLLRLGAQDGSYQPFVLEGKARNFNLEIKDVLGEKESALPTALAVGKKYIALAVDTRIVLLDKLTARPVKTLQVTMKVNPDGPELPKLRTPSRSVSALAFNPQDLLYALCGGSIAVFEPETDGQRLLATQPAASPRSLAFAANGDLAIADHGPDSDVKIVSPQGAFYQTIGRPGGRPLRGVFDPAAMMRVSSIAYDGKGRLWAAENWNFPRRFSVWNPDGSLNKDFVGGTGYAATSTFLHDSDPTLAYDGPVEMKLDRAAGTWKVTRVLWYPGEGENFLIDTGVHTQPQRFRSKASGTEREYMFVPPFRPWLPLAVFVEKGDHFEPVSAMGSVVAMSPHDDKGTPTGPPAGAFEGHDPNEGFFWNDLNGDAKVQKEELTFLPVKAAGQKTAPALNPFAGWGMRMSPDDLSFSIEGMRFKPTGFGPAGEPRFGLEGATPVPAIGSGDTVEVPGEHLLLNLNPGTTALNGADGLRGIDLATGAVKWTFPNPFHSVHGSHRAPMSQPGLVIGPLKIMGTGRLDGDLGSVFALRGNLGEDYFLTSDGLYVGALFHDTRRPTEELPATVEALRGRTLAGFSEGGEPFSGWFSRQADGKYRIATSIGRNCGLTVEVLGLNSIQRFQAEPVTLTATDLAKADADNANRAKANLAPKSYVIRKVAKPMAIDGKPGDWSRITALKAGADPKSSASIKLAYDADHLYALFEVNDASPMLNQGKDYTQLFKSGDAVDLQLATSLQAKPGRKEPGLGDLRLILAESAGAPVAVLMQPVAPGAAKALAKTYSSPVGSRTFDRVEILQEAQVVMVKERERYTVEAAIPLAALGLKPEPALEIRGDAGYISSDAAGLTNTARTYWSNQNTGLVNDLPGEAALRPAEWGSFQFSD